MQTKVSLQNLKSFWCTIIYKRVRLSMDWLLYWIKGNTISKRSMSDIIRKVETKSTSRWVLELDINLSTKKFILILAACPQLSGQAVFLDILFHSPS